MFTKADNMSSAAVSQFYDVGVVLQNKLNQMPLERRMTGMTVSAPVNRNFSVGNFSAMGLPPQASVMDNQSLQGLTKDHRKLDRSYSEPCDTMNNNTTNLNATQKQSQVNSSRYKTELCRPFEESGHCKYADKCQFAHGIQELKQLQRHPKYKTELCRTFHSKGFCPYGPRCNFVHNEIHSLTNQKVNDKNNATTVQQQAFINQQAINQQAAQYFQHISPSSLSQSPPPPQRPTSISFNSSFSGSMGSVTDSSPPSSVGSGSPSLSPVFFGEDAPVMNSCYNNVPVNNSLNYNNSTNNPVFSNISELASMDLGPLNVQTQMNNTDFNVFTQNFSSMLNLNSHCNSVSGDELESSLFVGQLPPSSPDSISGESVASANSLTTNSSYSSCGSPVEMGKNFRLPIFNMISQD